MLSYFKIKNFKSIVESGISFQFKEGKLPNGYRNSEIIYGLTNIHKKSKNIFVPTSILIGENASGKTTVINAFKVFQLIIQTNDLWNELWYLPNILNNNNENTEFEIGIIINKNIYKYKIQYNSNSILEESLYKDDKIVYQIQNTKTNFKNIVFKEKKLNEENINNIFIAGCINKNNLQYKLFLSLVGSCYQGLNDDIFFVYKNIIENLEIYSSNNFPSNLAIDKLSQNNSDEEIQKSFNRIVLILQKLDIAIKSAVFKRESKKKLNELININEQTYSSIKISQNKIDVDTITTQHKNLKGELVNFNFQKQESLGTQKLFGIIGIFLNVLDNGKVLIMDELEQSLHPILLKSLVMMFKDKRYNKNNAQLIFTTHNTDILEDNILRISEVNIVNKNLKNGTKIINLTEFEDENEKHIKNITNFRKQYLNGLYGGIPFITL